MVAVGGRSQRHPGFVLDLAAFEEDRRELLLVLDPLHSGR